MGLLLGSLPQPARRAATADGGLPNSAPLILANIRALGFDASDVELILNSHVHLDYAGGIAALQRATGARVAASAASAEVLERGEVGPDDPQHGVAFSTPPVRDVERVTNGQTVTVGRLALKAHFTGGHTPGGTTWAWRSCEADRCLDFIYADSQTPVSADSFRFSDGDVYPSALADFERGFAVLERISCDVLITPHPGASPLWERVATAPDGLVDGRHAGAMRRARVGSSRSVWSGRDVEGSGTAGRGKMTFF